MTHHMDRASELRRLIYDRTLTTGIPPAVAELAAASGLDLADVRNGLQPLAAGRIVVLQPGSGELLMVPPFSAVPTPFVVESPRHSSFANCAWDALGVAVMLCQPVEVVTACGCCGESMRLDVSPDAAPNGTGVIHFAVPARRWWDDIVFT